MELRIRRTKWSRLELVNDVEWVLTEVRYRAPTRKYPGSRLSRRHHESCGVLLS
jgi:hypothetical protein